jgi:multidrug efflux pump subunit AcrA (membrane-fusion protein)
MTQHSQATTLTQQQVPENRRSLRQDAWAAILVVGVVLLILVVWLSIRTRPHPVQVAVRDVVSYALVSGQVIAPPSARVDIRNQYAVPVERVVATVGQHVHAGQTLVQLSFPSLEEAQAQAQEQLTTARKAYADLAQQYKQDIAFAQQQLTLARRDAARVGVTSSDDSASVDANQPPDDNPSNVTPDGSITSPDPSSTDAAAPDPSIDQARLDLKQAEDHLAQLSSEATTALLTQQLQVSDARKALRSAQNGNQIAYIRAPIAGTVVALNAQPGALLDPKKSPIIATIIDLTQLQIASEIAPQQALNLKPAMPVAINFRELSGQRISGKVAGITTRIKSSFWGLKQKTQYIVLIQPDKEQDSIRPAMHVQALIQTAIARNVLAIPNDAIIRNRQGQPTVRIQRDGAWQTVAVTTGLRGNYYTEIRSGLESGENAQAKPNPFGANPPAV